MHACMHACMCIVVILKKIEYIYIYTYIYIYSQHLLTIVIIVENSVFSLLQEDYMDIARPTR